MKKELVLIENGKEVKRIDLNKNVLYVVLNDNETFSPINGSSIWEDKLQADNMDTADYEQTFKGNKKIKGVRRVISL